jgi:hypothetical protein
MQSSEVAFKVICAEVKEGQTPEEALQSNSFLVNQSVNGQVNQTQFPLGSPTLNQNKKYAWQVLEVSGKNILNSSETGVFTVACESLEPPVPVSYADVKSSYTGKRYYFSSSVNFSFNNPYAKKKLAYSIIEIGTREKVSNLPEITMEPGLNKIILSIEDLKGLKKNQEYKIEIYNLTSTTNYFNFIIKE